MKKVIIGVDPGKDGAVVVLGDGETFHLFERYKMPLIGREYDERGLVGLFLSFKNRAENARIPLDLKVLIEDVHSVYGASAQANFSFGFGVGLLRGAAIAADMPLVLVNPKRWQKVCFEGIRDIKKVGQSQKGRGDRDTKAMALIAAKRLFPTTELHFGGRASVPHNGLIDALMIAYYGKTL